MNALLSRTLLAAGLGLLTMAPSFADGGRTMPRTVLPAYTQECGACHVPFPPGMLPARSWQRVMGGLDRHYGSDASLDPALTRQIGDWLQAHAGTGTRAVQEPPQDRITRSGWFMREHREIDPAVWTLPSVKSAANCAACHVGAETGRFDDDALRTPAGLSLRQRAAWWD